MTSINAVPTARPIAPRGRNAGPAGAGFTLAGPGGVADPSGVRPPERTMLQAGLLALQDEADGVDERARRRAKDLIDRLASLQLSLLGGAAATRESLAGLRALLRDLPRPTDRRLSGVLAAVAVRIEVELARHELE